MNRRNQLIAATASLLVTLSTFSVANAGDSSIYAAIHKRVKQSRQRERAAQAGSVKKLAPNARRNANIASKVRGVIESEQQRDAARVRRVLMGLYGANSAKPKSQTAQGTKQLRKAKNKSDEAKQVKRLGKPAKTTVMPLSSPEPVYLIPLDTPEERKTPMLINPDNRAKSKQKASKQKASKRKGSKQKTSKQESSKKNGGKKKNQ